MNADAELRLALRAALGGLTGVFAAAAGLVALFLLIPIAIIFPMSLTSDHFLTWPPDLFSLRWFTSFVEDPVWTAAFWRSVRIAVPVALIATVLGTAAALGVARVARGRRALQTLFIAPLVLPIISYALGLYDISDRLQLVGSTWPVVIGQTMLAAPLVFITVSAGIALLDTRLPRAAASLGANWWKVIWKVELPLLGGPIAAGALFALAYSFDEIVVALFLSPPGNGTLPVQILSSTAEDADPLVAAASMLVIGVASLLAGLVLMVRVVFRGRTG